MVGRNPTQFLLLSLQRKREDDANELQLIVIDWQGFGSSLPEATTQVLPYPLDSIHVASPSWRHQATFHCKPTASEPESELRDAKLQRKSNQCTAVSHVSCGGNHLEASHLEEEHLEAYN